jgi:signal transduction histidine kinase
MRKTKTLYAFLLLFTIIVVVPCNAQKTSAEYHKLAKEQFNIGNYAEAFNLNSKALNIAEQTKDDKQLCIAHKNVGSTYYYLVNKKEALNSFFKALGFANKCGNDSLKAILFRNIGSVYTELHISDSALVYLNKSIPLYIKYKKYDQISAVYCVIADLYTNNLNKYDMAIKFIKKAEKYANMSNKIEYQIFVLLKYSSYYRGTKNYKLAINCAQKAHDLENTRNDLDAKIYAKIALAEAYSLDGNSKALNIYRDVLKLKDSIFKKETANKIANYKVVYDTEKKETENKLLQQENSLNKLKIEARNKTIIGLLIGVALIVLLIVWRLNVIKLKKKLAEIETEKKLQYDRERISRDLHDNVGGQLSYHLANALRGVTGNLRETIWALNKEELTVQDISDKLKLYTRNMFAYNNIKLKFNDAIENDTPLNPAFALNIFRICQEIINNVFKHAQATELIINITKNKNIQITIVDNGIGFSSNANDSNSFGLSNLQTRANEINAKLIIESEMNKGTSITLVV